MKIASLTTIIYGVLVAGGGLMGYLQAKSAASLIAGLGFGIAIAVCGWLMTKGVATATYAALALTVFLILFFGYRFMSAGKFMPAGLMTILSLLALFFILMGRFSDN